MLYVFVLYCFCCFFFFNDTATTEIYTLSLHDALPISQASQLELNVMMPVIAYNLLFSIEILSNGINAFTEKCVTGIEADAKRCEDYADATLAMATALNPLIGYAPAAEVSKEAYKSGKSIRQIAVEKGILDEKNASRILDPRKLTGN